MATRIPWLRLNFSVPLAVTALLVHLSGCGGEDPISDPRAVKSQGARQPDAGAASSRDKENTGKLPSETAFEAEAQSPGFVDLDYPAAPYGFEVGSVIANLSFFGWRSPRAAGHSDISQASVIQLAEFYDPEGDKGIELLMINASAVWCGACQTEYADLRDAKVYETLQPRGLEILGVLFEDAQNAPPRYVDLQNWSGAFNVGFPMALDPGFQMGVFFDRAFTPMNMVVDARTMKILYASTGYKNDLFALILGELGARGR